MELVERRAVLEAAGLTVLDESWSGNVPEPSAAWRPIIAGSAEPSSTIRHDAPDVLKRVDAEWYRQARAVGVLDGHGEFLISVAGDGAAAESWARVRCSAAPTLAEAMEPGWSGGGEFAALSMSGRVVCGVTVEENEYWVLSARLDA
jgi:hypothetical protein